MFWNLCVCPDCSKLYIAYWCVGILLKNLEGRKYKLSSHLIDELN